MELRKVQEAFVTDTRRKASEKELKGMQDGRLRMPTDVGGYKQYSDRTAGLHEAGKA